MFRVSGCRIYRSRDLGFRVRCSALVGKVAL